MAGAGTVATVGVTKWCLEMDPYKRNAFRKLLPFVYFEFFSLSLAIFHTPFVTFPHFLPGITLEGKCIQIHTDRSAQLYHLPLDGAMKNYCILHEWSLIKIWR
jgi:hypothetical protein